MGFSGLTCFGSFGRLDGLKRLRSRKDELERLDGIEDSMVLDNDLEDLDDKSGQKALRCLVSGIVRLQCDARGHTRSEWGLA